MSDGIQIRLATLDDEQLLIDFICNHWRHDHVFVKHPWLMKWQHEYPDDIDSLTFVIAHRAKSGSHDEVLALLGFMPFRRFDVTEQWTDMSLALWKVREDVHLPGLGLQLLNFLQRNFKPRLVCAIGISQMVKAIYVVLGYTVERMFHCALFTVATTNLNSVARNVPSIAQKSTSVDEDVSFTNLIGDGLPPSVTEQSVIALTDNSLPQKTWAYILNRYVRHPFYTYEIRFVIADTSLCAVLVWREVKLEFGRSILRIVDVIGQLDVLNRCSALLRTELTTSNSDYIDIVYWRKSGKSLQSGGFVYSDEYPDLILPNYFEPFEQRNVDMELAVKVTDSMKHLDVQLFRADSDQDRPNIIFQRTEVH